MRKSTPLKDSDAIVGNTTVVKVVKNKVAPPLRQATFDMIFGQGISKGGELLDEGVRLGLIARTGAWYKLTPEVLGADGTSDDDTPFAQGREKAKAYLEGNPEVAQTLETRIRELCQPQAQSPPANEATDAGAGDHDEAGERTIPTP